MRLKTYLVTHMSEAMPLIKRDLGEEALILSTKKVKTGGLFGFWQKEKLEVTAACETTQPSSPVPVPQKQPASVVQPATSQPSAELLAELKNIKRFMMHAVKEDGLPDALEAVRTRFTAQGINAQIQAEILTKLMQVHETAPETSIEEMDGYAREELLAFVESKMKPIRSGKQDFICFVGPTGVGKTTTIAKIAADFMLRQGKRVGLITADTYRIAAVEQLKTYADILAIPVQVVDEPAALKSALTELEECDIILMDTAGRNYQQQKYIEDLEGLLAGKDNLYVSLVLSLTAKYEDMKRILHNFESFAIDELLLTKQDETASPGAIVNLLAETDLPLSFIANGQNVPDDLIAATPERVVSLVWEERSDD